MNSVILRVSSRFVLPAAILFSLYVLLRGHNEPGGGFIGGLIAAAGLTVHGLAFGRAVLLALLRLSPKAIIGLGLAPALISGLPALFLAEPYLTHQWGTIAGLAIGTTLLFDIGVYLVVIGAVLTFLVAYLDD